MIEFPFVEFSHPVFGTVLRPVANVLLSHEAYALSVEMLVDSGADLSMIPKTIGDQLGFILERGEMVYTVGGIGGGIPVVYRSVFLTVGETSLPIRIAWGLSDEIPSVLGRLDVFDYFDIEFVQHRKVVIFREPSE
jgi:hypothetical protein